MLFCANGFIHITLHKVSPTNLMLEMVEASKNFKVEDRDHVLSGLGTVLM